MPGRSAKPVKKAATGGKADRKPDRAATEAALMDAALALMERDGLLAGLSLQEVADEAGVNRGLIHHYFGSRRVLMRAATERALTLAAPDYENWRKEAPAEKSLHYFRQYQRNSSFPKLLALLALDGDEEMSAIAFAEEQLADLEREQAEGYWDPDVDLLAMIIGWHSTLIGYFVMREALAKQFDLDLRELDARLLTVLDREYSSVRGQGQGQGKKTARRTRKS